MRDGSLSPLRPDGGLVAIAVPTGSLMCYSPNVVHRGGMQFCKVLFMVILSSRCTDFWKCGSKGRTRATRNAWLWRSRSWERTDWYQMAFLLLFSPMIKDAGGWGVESWGADARRVGGVWLCWHCRNRVSPTRKKCFRIWPIAIAWSTGWCTLALRLA